MIRTRLPLCLVASLACAYVTLVPVRAQEAVFLHHRWELDPDIGSVFWKPEEVPPFLVDPTAIENGTLQQRVNAAQRIIVAQRGSGVNDRDQCWDVVLAAIEKGEENRHAFLALVSAGVSLAEKKADVEKIWQLVGDHREAREAVEPALISWESDIALELWRSRLDLEQVGQSDLLRAIDGIAAVGTSDDRDLLSQIVVGTGSTMPARMSASRALGKLVSTGLESFASEMMQSNLPMKELLVAEVLHRHATPEAEVFLKQIISGPHQPAHLVAYQALANSFPSAALEIAAEMIKHPDNTVRRVAIEVLHTQDDVESLNLQATALVDRNVKNRRLVREHLEAKAKNEQLRPVVDEIITFMLEGERFEGTEQAILLAVALGESHRAETMVQLLDHPRDEVNVRAGWALQAMDLDEIILEELMRRCQVTTDKLVGEKVVIPNAEILRTSFLFEAMGKHAFRPANDMLMLYVPKNAQKFRLLTRTSAIYALGHIWAGQENAPLAKALAQRMLDNSVYDPEFFTVKYASAIALGRMTHKSSIQKLEQAENLAPLSNARDWAIEQLQSAE